MGEFGSKKEVIAFVVKCTEEEVQGEEKQELLVTKAVHLHKLC